MPNNHKAMFIQAREHFKLGENTEAAEFINKGIEISKKLNHDEYRYRFNILKETNKKPLLFHLRKLY